MLSPSSEVDRAVCDRFADCASFTTPDEPESNNDSDHSELQQAGTPGPADVAACTSLDAQLLEVPGKHAD
ncbi:hypothetical protein [Streptomyces yangpuensis]